jgi:hypothetical protein
MPQEIGEIYKSLIPSLSDDSSVEEAFQMYHYGTASYNGNNLQTQSIEKHLVNLNEDVVRIDSSIANLSNIYIEETSSSLRPNIIAAGDISVIPLTIKGIPNQSVSLQKWQKDNGTAVTDVAQITNSGAASFSGYGTFGSSTPNATTGIAISLGGDHKGVTVRGVSGQTSNLQEWQDNLGSVLAKVDPLGNITAQNITSVNVTSTGTAFFNDLDINGLIAIDGNITTSSNITANKIALTSLTDSLTAAGPAVFSGTISVLGVTNTKNISTDGTITATGTITSTGGITAGGDLSGANLILSQSMTTTGNLTVNGIIKAQSPNSGTTGGVQIRGDASNKSYLQFTNSTSTVEYGNILGTATGLNISTNTSITGTLGVVSPTATGSVGVRQMYISTGDPLSTDGQNGDIWIKYV